VPLGAEGVDFQRSEMAGVASFFVGGAATAHRQECLCHPGAYATGDYDSLAELDGECCGGHYAGGS